MKILTEFRTIVNLDNMIAIYQDHPDVKAKYHNVLAELVTRQKPITLASFDTEDQAEKAIRYIAGRLSSPEGTDQVINMEIVKDIITIQ